MIRKANCCDLLFRRCHARSSVITSWVCPYWTGSFIPLVYINLYLIVKMRLLQVFTVHLCSIFFQSVNLKKTLTCNIILVASSCTDFCLIHLSPDIYYELLKIVK